MKTVKTVATMLFVLASTLLPLTAIAQPSRIALMPIPGGWHFDGERPVPLWVIVSDTGGKTTKRSEESWEWSMRNLGFGQTVWVRDAEKTSTWKMVTIRMPRSREEAGDIFTDLEGFYSTAHVSDLPGPFAGLPKVEQSKIHYIAKDASGRMKAYLVSGTSKASAEALFEMIIRDKEPPGKEGRR